MTVQRTPSPTFQLRKNAQSCSASSYCFVSLIPYAAKHLERAICTCHPNSSPLTSSRSPSIQDFAPYTLSKSFWSELHATNSHGRYQFSTPSTFGTLRHTWSRLPPRNLFLSSAPRTPPSLACPPVLTGCSFSVTFWGSSSFPRPTSYSWGFQAQSLALSCSSTPRCPHPLLCV